MTRVQESLLDKIARGVLRSARTVQIHCSAHGSNCTVRVGLKESARGAKDSDCTGPKTQHGPCAEWLCCTGLSARSVLVVRVIQRPVLLGLQGSWAGLELGMGHDAGFGL